MFKYTIILIFTALSFGYYVIPDGSVGITLSRIFLTMTSFLFAIFTGFFIARQGTRYSGIRDNIAEFDGAMSAIFRFFGHLGEGIQNEAKQIIQRHYETILEKKKWDYHFVNKSSTISSLHHLLEKEMAGRSLKSLQNFALQRILVNLKILQGSRKKMIALHTERIPLFQWALLWFLALMLLVSVSVIQSQYDLFGSILKGAFSSAVLFVLVLLNEFDKLRFFEGIIGEHSARDVLDIFAGKK